MPSILHLTPQLLDNIEKRKKYSIAVVGCGHKGTLLANAFADVGFGVVCTDADASVVKKMAKGKTVYCDPTVDAKLKTHIASEKINVTTDLKKATSQSDIVFVAITAKLNDQKKIDDHELINTFKQVGTTLRPGTIVVYSGIAAVGFTENTIKDLLENNSGLKTGQDFGLAYCPLFTTNNSIANLKLLVAAYDKISLETTISILRTITHKIQEINDLKIAELTMLFTITQQEVKKAVSNELAMFCEKTAIDYNKVLDTLSLSDANFQPSIANIENHEAVYMLLENAESLNIKLRIPTLARQINEDMIKHAVNLTYDAFRSGGKNLRRGRVTIFGSANSPSSACMFAQLIEQKGAKATIYDPTAKKDTKGIVKTSLNEAVEGTDCIVILSEIGQFDNAHLKKIKSLMRPPAIVVDLMGNLHALNSDTEGFIYTSLGKGIEKK